MLRLSAPLLEHKSVAGLQARLHEKATRLRDHACHDIGSIGTEGHGEGHSCLASGAQIPNSRPQVPLSSSPLSVEGVWARLHQTAPDLVGMLVVV